MGNCTSKKRNRQPQQVDLSAIDTSLNKDVFSLTLQFLSRPEAAKLARTNKFFAQSVRNLHAGWRKELFFREVSRGHEDNIQDMLSPLRENGALHSVLSNKINFTDYSGRTYHNITAFQLAVFYLDSPMRDLLASYMSKEEVARQIREIEENGIDYDISLEDYNRLRAIAPNIAPPLKNGAFLPQGPVTLNEKHYDWCFRILQVALQAYIDAVRPMIQNNNYNWNELDRLWKNVGIAQSYLTTPFINAYCDDELSFAQVPDFNSITLARKSSFYSWRSGCDYDWFREFGSAVLENSFGVIPCRACCIAWPCSGRGAGAGAPAENLLAITALCETRITDYQNFNDDVLKSAARRSQLRYQSAQLLY